ncbi:MAG: 3',5'-cyclic-AMP phosphodiesterase [Aquisalimonadaceae bacterium]
MTASNGDPSRAPAALRVLQITDTHLFGDRQRELGGVNSDHGCRQVFDLVARDALPADLLLLTGDLVHDGSVEAYRRLRERADALGVPGLVIPGNHDNAGLMREIFAEGRVRWQGHLELGDWLVIMLDSTIEGKPGGHLAPAELQRLDDLLTRRPRHHALICLHHHPLPMGSQWIDQIGVDNGEALFAVLDRHSGVRAVLWGHVHQEFQASHGAMQLLACPSTCLQFAPGQREFTVDAEAPGYRTLNLYADGRIDTRVRRLETIPGSVDLRLAGY